MTGLARLPSSLAAAAVPEECLKRKTSRALQAWSHAVRLAFLLRQALQY